MAHQLATAWTEYYRSLQLWNRAEITGAISRLSEGDWNEVKEKYLRSEPDLPQHYRSFINPPTVADATLHGFPTFIRVREDIDRINEKLRKGLFATNSFQGVRGSDIWGHVNKWHHKAFTRFDESFDGRPAMNAIIGGTAPPLIKSDVTVQPILKAVVTIGKTTSTKIQGTVKIRGRFDTQPLNVEFLGQTFSVPKPSTENLIITVDETLSGDVRSLPMKITHAKDANLVLFDEIIQISTSVVTIDPPTLTILNSVKSEITREPNFSTSKLTGRFEISFEGEKDLTVSFLGRTITLSNDPLVQNLDFVELNEVLPGEITSIEFTYSTSDSIEKTKTIQIPKTIIDRLPTATKDKVISYLQLLEGGLAILTNRFFFTITNEKSEFEAMVTASIKFFQVGSKEFFIPPKSILKGVVEVVDIEQLLALQSTRGSFGVLNISGTFRETDNLRQEIPPPIPSDEIISLEPGPGPGPGPEPEPEPSEGLSTGEKILIGVASAASVAGLAIAAVLSKRS